MATSGPHSVDSDGKDETVRTGRGKKKARAGQLYPKKARTGRRPAVLSKTGI